MKIARYHGASGRGDYVRFIKGEDRSVLSKSWDRIYISTLFSFEFGKIAKSIDFAIEATRGQNNHIFVGGIAASLMHERFLKEPRWFGIRFIKGLLSEPPAVALQLDDFWEEYGADDVTGTPIEDLVPDYSILSQVDYRYPVADAYFAYTSRGCIRTCHFCGVPKLEGAQRDTPSLTNLVRTIEREFGARKDLVLMDNNVVASSRFKEIIAEIRDLGFIPGATLQRPGQRVAVKRRVDFNQGVDARILSKDPMYLRELSTTCLKPLRIAFDHLGLKKPYERAVRMAAEFGLTDLSNYMLYNFHDDPADLFERMRLNVALNEELGIRIWSFPMRYQPIDLPHRGHVGPKWTRYQLRSMQLILQATHGVVSGEPDFFKWAFGDCFSDFEKILLLPHDMIFNRMWFERFDPSERLADFRALFGNLDKSDRSELLALLSACDPSGFGALPGQASAAAVKSILRFYVPLSKEDLASIWGAQRLYGASSGGRPLEISDDELVEDAGLSDDDDSAVSSLRAA